MFRIELPTEEWQLLLTPRFSYLGAAWQWTWLVLLAAVPIVLLLCLYRYELRIVRRPIAAALLLLRGLLVLLLWFIVCWQPILARPHQEEIPSRIVIAVDGSESMQISDPQRTLPEKEELARALRIKPAEVDRLTRSQIAGAILSPKGMDLVRKLAVNHEVELIGFDQTVWEFQPAALLRDAEGIAAGKAKGSKAAAGSGFFTDLGQPLLRALQGSTKDKGKLLSVLLLTDGRHNSGEPPEKKAKEFKDRGISIHPVALGSTRTPPDVALTKVVAPTNLLQHTPATISAQVKVAGVPDRDLVVELLQDGKLVSEKTTHNVQHRAATGDVGESLKVYKDISFPLPAEKLGTQALTLRVRPVKGKIDEINHLNNSKTVILRVVEDKAKVLLIDAEARWEYYYLANALQRDEGVQLDRVLFLQPRINQIPKQQLTEAGFPKERLPDWDADQKSADPLEQYHCILLGDVPPEQLPVEERSRLAKFVSDRGGTLVVMAGKRAMPLSYLPASEKNEKDAPLAKMLPISAPRVFRSKEGFPISLTPEGSSASYLQLEESSANNLKRWQELPPHYWAVIGKAKPGATCLATLDAGSKGSGDNGLNAGAKSQRDDCLVLVQQYGFGRVIYIGLDSTWRWRYRRGDSVHHRVWGQLILWAASDQLLPAGNKHVRFGSKQVVHRDDEPVEVFVRLQEAAPKLSPGGKAQVRILLQKDDGEEETAAIVPLKPQGTGLRRFRATVDTLPAGKYRIELDIPELEKDGGRVKDEESGLRQRDTFVVLAKESQELAELTANVNLLDRLATDGKAMTPEQLDDLVERLNDRVTVRTHREEQRPWEDQPLTWYLLVGFLALLSAEWVLRKLVGLP